MERARELAAAFCQLPEGKVTISVDDGRFIRRQLDGRPQWAGEGVHLNSPDVLNFPLAVSQNAPQLGISANGRREHGR